MTYIRLIGKMLDKRGRRNKRKKYKMRLVKLLERKVKFEFEEIQ